MPSSGKKKTKTTPKKAESEIPQSSKKRRTRASSVGTEASASSVGPSAPEEVTAPSTPTRRGRRRAASGDSLGSAAARKSPRRSRALSTDSTNSRVSTASKSSKGSAKKSKTKTKAKSFSKEEKSRTEQESSTSGPTMDVQVHRLRHLDYVPSQVLSMTSCEGSSNHGGYVAVSRLDGSIELLEVTAVDEYADGKKQTPHIFPLTKIYGSKRLVAHSLQWVPSGDSEGPLPPCVAASPDGTLWTVHFSGTSSQQLQSRITSGGGGVFDLGTCRGTSVPLPLVAGACQDGSIRIWQVSTKTGTLQEPPVATLPTTGAAILSLAWKCIQEPHTNVFKTALYAGVADSTIRKFTLDFQMNPDETGDMVNLPFQLIQQTTSLRMTVETRGRRTPTKIWTMQALNDGSLVTGNSLGQVQVWNTSTGTLLQSMNQSELKADVLRLVLNSNETKIFASGVDSRVACFARSSPTDSEWKITTAQRPHTHDLKSMTLVQAGKNRRLEALITGGVDTKLCSYLVSDFSKRRPQVWYPWPCASPISTAVGTRVMSMHRDNHIELYRLQDAQNKALPAKHSSCELVGEIAIESNSNLVASALSNDGRFLGACNSTALFLFHLETELEDGELSVIPQKLSLPPKLEKMSCVSMRFHGSTLALADTRRKIYLLDLSNISAGEEIDFSVIDAPSSSEKSEMLPIHSIEISASGTYLTTMTKALVDGIQVFKRKGGKYIPYWNIAGFSDSRPAAMVAINDDKVAVATSSFELYVFDLQDQTLSKWSETNGFPIERWPSELSNRKDFPVRLLVDPSNENRLIMASFGAFVVFNLAGELPKHCRIVPETHVRRRRKRSRQDNGAAGSFFSPSEKSYQRRSIPNNPNGKNCTVCLHYNSMLYMDFMGSSEIVVVEQPWLRVISTFPDALQRRVYGVN